VSKFSKGRGEFHPSFGETEKIRAARVNEVCYSGRVEWVENIKFYITR